MRASVPYTHSLLVCNVFKLSFWLPSCTAPICFKDSTRIAIASFFWKVWLLMHFFFLWGGCRTYCEGLSSEEQCKEWIQVELLLHSYTVPICVQDSTRFAIASFLESLIVDALFRSFRRVQDILWRTQFWKTLHNLLLLKCKKWLDS